MPLHPPVHAVMHMAALRCALSQTHAASCIHISAKQRNAQSLWASARSGALGSGPGAVRGITVGRNDV